jgi:hypothetical protein
MGPKVRTFDLSAVNLMAFLVVIRAPASLPKKPWLMLITFETTEARRRIALVTGSASTAGVGSPRLRVNAKGPATPGSSPLGRSRRGSLT